jgi:hypothetical protein
VYGLSESRPRLRRGWVSVLALAAFAPTTPSCDVSDEGLGAITLRGDAAPRPDGAAVGTRPIDEPAPDAAVADADESPDAAMAPPVPGPGGPTPEGLPDAAPPAPDAGRPPEALLLVGDADLSPGDTVLSRRLAALGFRVLTRQILNEGNATAAVQMARTATLVVISSSVPNGTGVARQTGALAVPILCSSAAFLDDLGISGEEEQGEVRFAQSALQILAPGHPLAAGRIGRVMVSRGLSSFSYAQITGDAIAIAGLVGDRDDVGIVGLEKGARSTLGPAPARRVGWFALEATFPGLSADGWALFDAAVRWLLEAP